MSRRWDWIRIQSSESAWQLWPRNAGNTGPALSRTPSTAWFVDRSVALFVVVGTSSESGTTLRLGLFRPVIPVHPSPFRLLSSVDRLSLILPVFRRALRTGSGASASTISTSAYSGSFPAVWDALFSTRGSFTRRSSRRLAAAHPPQPLVPLQNRGLVRETPRRARLGLRRTTFGHGPAPPHSRGIGRPLCATLERSEGLVGSRPRGHPRHSHHNRQRGGSTESVFKPTYAQEFIRESLLSSLMYNTFAGRGIIQEGQVFKTPEATAT